MDQKIKKEALDILIFRELAIQEADRQGMKVAPEYVERSFGTFVHIMDAEGEYDSYLSQMGLTEESLKKDIERDELFNMIVDKEIIQKIPGNEKNAEMVQKRKQEWETELKKDAKIEITLEEVEKKLKELKEKAGKNTRQ